MTFDYGLMAQTVKAFSDVMEQIQKSEQCSTAIRVGALQAQAGLTPLMRAILEEYKK